MLKKTIALLLCLLMAGATLAGCGKPEDPGKQETSTSTSTSQETETDDGWVHDALGDVTYNGYEFRVISMSATDCGPENYDGSNTTIIEDAVYTRNEYIKNRLGITFNMMPKDNYSEVTQVVKQSVTAGSDEYDLAFVHMVEGTSLASSGSLYDLSAVDHINLDAIWWDQDSVDGFSVAGHIYLVAGDILPDTLLKTACVAFNKNLLKDNGMEYPYDDAANGTWTMDKLIAMTTNATHDLSGDGAITPDKDFYGVTSWHLDSPYNLFYGCGGAVVVKDSDDIPSIQSDLNATRNQAVYDKVYQLIITNNSFFSKDVAAEYPYTFDIFTEGRAFFTVASLSTLGRPTFKEMKQDYGVLPSPKYDESQENYEGFVNGAAAMLCIPKTVKDGADIERVGAITEAMANASYNLVTPVLYEKIAKTTTVKDQESSAMVDIIIRNRVFDFGYAHFFGDPTANAGVCVAQTCLDSKSQSIASTLKSASKILSQKLPALVDKYENGN